MTRKFVRRPQKHDTQVFWPFRNMKDDTDSSWEGRGMLLLQCRRMDKRDLEKERTEIGRKTQRFQFNSIHLKIVFIGGKII